MLKTAELFQSGMVLQRQKPIHIWGSAEAGETVNVSVAHERGKTEEQAQAEQDGKWHAVLPPMESCEEVTVTVSAGEEKIVLTDVAVGEVWLAGGQSNMEFWMRYEKHKNEALADCANTRVRFYDVPKVCYDGQRDDFDYSRVGVWRKADPENLDYFSAVGYYFEKVLEKTLDVPVGIVGCNWGGTTASVWMDRKSVEKAGNAWIEEYERKAARLDMDAYWKEQRLNPMNDKGNLFDPFTEMALPRTLTQEETMAYFADLAEKAKAAGKDLAELMQDYLQPQTVPGCLYEHMIKTVAPFSLRGFLWYQGESDDDVPGMNVLYQDMLTALIGDWRKLWGEQLPFLFVQLPGYEKWLMNTAQNHYPVIRQCQQGVADTVQGAYLCSISDVGEEFDIHPKDKKTVGERLALLARHYVYGEDVLCDAPRAKEIRREGERIAITFLNAGKGLFIEGDQLNAMQVSAGEREIPFAAEARGNVLTLTLKEPVEEEVLVAFAKTSWYQVNLYNDAHIPAVPFAFCC